MRESAEWLEYMFQLDMRSETENMVQYQTGQYLLSISHAGDEYVADYNHTTHVSTDLDDLLEIVARWLIHTAVQPLMKKYRFQFTDQDADFIRYGSGSIMLHIACRDEVLCAFYSDDDNAANPTECTGVRIDELLEQLDATLAADEAFALRFG